MGMPSVLKLLLWEDNSHADDAQNNHHEQGSVDNTPCRAFDTGHKTASTTKVHACPKRSQEPQRGKYVLRC